MFNVRRMNPEDFEFAVKITDTMNWNLTEEDFKFMTSLEPDGCFILLYGSERVGLATTIFFEGSSPLGWIGNLIVDEDHRKMGGGAFLVNHALNYLKNRGAKAIGLYSYREQVGFYTKLGFKREEEFTVLFGKVQSNPFGKMPIKNGKGDMGRIMNLDAYHFGASRERLLKKIAASKQNPLYCVFDRGGVLGYVMAKVYSCGYAEVGPLLCLEGLKNVASSLLGAVLEGLENFEVSICVLKREEEIFNQLMEAGLRESFDVVRMFYGQSALKKCIYSPESLERG
ncbi:MAG: GNAT family N-acetyltransferase [Candidatus Bathyarchaeia archaeon]